MLSVVAAQPRRAGWLASICFWGGIRGCMVGSWRGKPIQRFGVVSQHGETTRLHTVHIALEPCSPAHLEEALRPMAQFMHHHTGRVQPVRSQKRAIKIAGINGTTSAATGATAACRRRLLEIAGTWTSGCSNRLLQPQRRLEVIHQKGYNPQSAWPIDSTSAAGESVEPASSRASISSSS